MARTGSFGRLPRSQPSLTSTLVSIAKEMQNQEDQNMMDAWQKGGSIDGKKVTDAMMLAYWNQRLTGISKDDPLYDTYKNAIQQYTYTIAESKMTAQYAMKANPTSADDSAMVAFYLNWAKKVPNDSEFYRTLQRDAGQYLKSAQAKRVANSATAAENNYKAQRAATLTKGTAGDNALQAVTLLAQHAQGSYLDGRTLGDPSNAVDTSNLLDSPVSDLPTLVNLISGISIAHTATPKGGRQNALAAEGTQGRVTSGYSGNPEVLYYDEAGKPVTGADLVAAARAQDPTFNGNFDLTYVQNALTAKRDALEKAQALAKKTGHLVDAQNDATEIARTTKFIQTFQATDVLTEYQRIKADIANTEKDQSLLPGVASARVDADKAAIGALAGDPRIADNFRLQTQFRDEAAGKPGTLTANEDPYGLNTEGTNLDSTGASAGGKSSEVDALNTTLDYWKQQSDLVANSGGAVVWTQGKTVMVNGQATFVAQPGGSVWGAAPMQSPDGGTTKGVADIAQQAGTQAVVTLIPSGDGTQMVSAAVVPISVQTVMKRPDGTVVKSAPGASPNVLQAIFVNGKVQYKYTDPGTHASLWFDAEHPLWDPNKVHANVDLKSGTITLDLSGMYTPPQTGTGTGGSGYHGYTNVGTTAGGIGRVGVSASGTGGTEVYDPMAVFQSSNPSAFHAGYTPGSDSFSPALNLIKGMPDGANILQQVIRTPDFQAILVADANQSAGLTWNAATQAWDGTDKQKSDAAAMGDQITYDTVTISNPNFNQAPPPWMRDTTWTAPNPVTGKDADPYGNTKTVPLPSAQANAAGSGNAFAMLTGVDPKTVFNVSTGQQPPAPPKGNVSSIKLGQPLTVPTAPVVNAQTGFTMPAAPPPVVAPTAPVGAYAQQHDVGTTSTLASDSGGGYSTNQKPKAF